MTLQIKVAPYDKHNEVLVGNACPPEWPNPMPDGRYNLLVIGGGSAGLVAAVGAAGVGAKVALVEKHLLGGDCLNVGCVPSKTLIRSAKAIGDIRRSVGEEFGVSLNGDVSVDFAAVMERVRRVRADISHHDSAWRFKDLGIDVYLGAGEFTSPTTFAVDGRTIEFSKAVIATGAGPAHIPIPGLAEAGYVSNVTLFQITEQPKRLAVIGAGPIGAEMAQAFARFGTEVYLFDMLPVMAGITDPDMLEILTRTFTAEGIHLRLESSIRKVEASGEAKRVIFEHLGETHTVEVDEILLAAGRKPNIDSLNLEAAGVETTGKGLVVDDRLQTTAKNIYGAGDVAIPAQFTHTADATARIVLQNALFMGRKKYSDLIIPWTVYTDPEIAHVGQFPHEAEAAGAAVDTFAINIEDTDRGRTDAEEGIVKIYVKKGTDQILGATIIARHAGEMISEITTAMMAGAGLGTLSQTIHPYPTQAEAIKKAADAWNRTRLTPTVARLFDTWLRWTR
jgi:pyruvate/2-oxoglutarate dehydrogenase complex dihydrolipoamide dehydrogenase (E3) component